MAQEEGVKKVANHSDKTNNELLIELKSCGNGTFIFSSTEKNVLQTLDHFRCEGEGLFCDVFLDVDGKSFPAHRNILAANSQYFLNLFTSGMSDSDQKHLKLNTVSVTAMETILEYFYRRTITITLENLEELLEGANYLLVEPIKEACVRVLIKNLNSSNYYSCKKIAAKFSLEEFKKALDDFLAKAACSLNFTWMGGAELAEFLVLPFEFLRDALSSDELMVDNERKVYSIICDWVGHDIENRKVHLEDLLQCLRLGSLPPQFLQDWIEKDPLLKENIKEKYLNGISDWSKRTRPSTELTTLIIGVEARMSFCYDVNAKVTYCLPGTQENNDFFHVVAEKDTVVAYHNNHGILYLASLYLNCDDPEWQDIPPFRYLMRTVFTLALVDDLIYVIGGVPGSREVVECYSGVMDQWSEAGTLKAPRHEPTVVSGDGKIFVIGGLTRVNPHKYANKYSLEIYDVKEKKWSIGSPTLTKRSGAKAVYADGKIYVHGGTNLPNEFTWLTQCEVYNTTTDQWHHIAPVRIPAVPGAGPGTFSATVVVNHEIYITQLDIEGVCNPSDSWKYNPTKNRWEWAQIFPKYKDLCNFKMCTVQTKKYSLRYLSQRKFDDLPDDSACSEIDSEIDFEIETESSLSD